MSKRRQWNLYVWWKYQVMLLLQQGGACSLNTWQSSVIMSCNELQFWQALISGHQMSLCLQYMLTIEAQAGVFFSWKRSTSVWCWYIVSSPTLMTLNLFIALWIPSYLVFKVAGIQSSNLIFNLFGATKSNYVWSCFKRVIE